MNASQMNDAENEIRRQQASAEADMNDALSRAAALTSDNHEDNIDPSQIDVNEADLKLLEGGDDDALEKMFNDKELDDDDLELLDEFQVLQHDEFDDENNEYNDFDVDAPDALEKLTALQNKKQESKKSTTPKEQPDGSKQQLQQTQNQTSTPSESREQSTRTPKTTPSHKQPSSRTNPASSNKSKTGGKSVPKPPASPALSEALLKERRAEFARLEKLLRQNIEDLSTQMKLLLVENKEESKAKAQKYLKVKQARQKDLEYLLDLASKDEDVPIYKTTPLALSSEDRDLSIELDQIVVILRAMTVPKDFKGHLELELELGSGLQGATKTFSGKKFIEINQELVFQLPKDCRKLQTFIRPIRLAKLKLTAFQKSLFWTKEVGNGETKLNPLLSETSMSSEVRLKTSSNESIGDVELSVKLSRPFVGKKIITETKNIIIIDKTASSATLHKEEQENYHQTMGHLQTEDIESDEESSNTASPTKSSTHPKATPKSVPTKSPSEQKVDSNKSVTTTTPTPSANEAPKPAVIPTSGDALLKYLNAPEGVTWDSIRLATSPGVMCSFDALGHEEAQCQAQLKTAQGEQLSMLKDRLENISQRRTFFEIIVGNGTITIEMYLQSLRDGIDRDTNILKTLILLAKHFKTLNEPQEVKEYSDNAKWLKGIIDIMKSELKTAEENMESLEEE